MDNNRRLGALWEERVADYLSLQGYVILEMNYRTRYSEIDVIAQDKEELVFIEVKYRKTKHSGDPLEAVTAGKIKRIRNAALYYLRDNGYSIDRTNIRFDAIGISGDGNESLVSHIKNAF